MAAAPEMLSLLMQAYDRLTDNDFVPPNSTLELWIKRAEATFEKIRGAA
jgi:hypothetical protein